MGQTQTEFALEVSSHQSLISKYERDLIDPPGALLIRCVNMIGPANTPAPVTEHRLVQLIRERLSGAEHAAARAAIAALITGMR